MLLLIGLVMPFFNEINGDLSCEQPVPFVSVPIFWKVESLWNLQSEIMSFQEEVPGPSSTGSDEVTSMAAELENIVLSKSDSRRSQENWTESEDEEEGIFPMTVPDDNPTTASMASFQRCFGMLDVRTADDGGTSATTTETDHLLSSGHRPSKPLHPLENAGLRGLRNIGNTCFMNSILQCLSNTEPLLDYVLSRQAYEVNRHSSVKGELFLAFARLVHDLWKPDKTHEADTSSLKDRIQKFCPTFRGARQHDAQELLRFLVEGLHNDINRVKQRPSLPPNIIPDEVPDEEKSRLAWDWNLKYDDSPIADIFVGQLKSTLTCLTCGHRSVTFDPFWDLSVSIPQPGVRGAPVSLQECLAAFTQEETLDGGEMPTCAKCQKAQPSTKRFSIQTFPDVLVIHLKRFTRDDRGKLRTVVKFPLENLDLGHFGDQPVSNCSYNLFGISNHYGTAFSGHYVAFAKHPYSKEWHQYDDSRVSPCDSEEVGGVEPYLLFYELSLASKCLMER